MGFMTLAHKLTSKTKAMKTFVKNYIAKGKKIENLDIVKVTFRIADLVKFAHQYKGEDFVTVEIARLKSPDQFGHDYTAYVNRLEEVAEPAPAEKPAKTSRKKARKEETQEVPF